MKSDVETSPAWRSRLTTRLSTLGWPGQAWPRWRAPLTRVLSPARSLRLVDKSRHFATLVDSDLERVLALPSIDEAHATLLGNDQLQFAFAPASAAPPPPPPLEWHLWTGSGGVTLVWIIVGLAALIVLGLVGNVLRKRPRRAAPSTPRTPEAEVDIAVVAARAALGDADRLAAKGRFSDAAHVLLACGVEAIAEHHPGLIRPASTSRDIAAMSVLPETMRKAFARIARSVEIGVFGGRLLQADDYAECREAFVTSALARRA